MFASIKRYAASTENFTHYVFLALGVLHAIGANAKAGACCGP